MRPPILAFALALLTLAPASAWGPVGHRMAATAALKDLPEGPARWFTGLEAILPAHANDPDHWKEHDPLEGPRHFLDSETYGGPEQVPFDEDAARAMLGPDLFQTSGQLPWTIQDRVQRLVTAFHAGVPIQVALEASWLSHYAADCNVPLHTTINHDGELTGQHGIHQRWESGLLDHFVSQEGWLPEVRPAVLGPSPSQAPWTWLQEAFNLVPRLLADDLTAKQAGSGSYGPLYWQTFLQLQETVVKERLNLSAQRTAEMILLAWTLAGSPPTPGQ